MNRRLVLTADDLGRETAGVRPILDLLACGPLTATTLIPVAPDSVPAAAACREAGVQPRLHVTLTSERGLAGWRPLTTDTGSLTDRAGLLHTDPRVLGERGDGGEVLAEVAAQWDWMLAQGLRPTGLDSHAGALYGLHGRSWLAETLRFCADRELAFRLPRDPSLFLAAEPVAAAAEPNAPAVVLERHAQAVGYADSWGVRLPAAIASRRAEDGRQGGYRALREDYLRLLGRLPEGTSEIFLHPAPPGAVAGPDGDVRGWELRLLHDPVFHRALDTEGLDLVPSW